MFPKHIFSGGTLVILFLIFACNVAGYSQRKKLRLASNEFLTKAGAKPIDCEMGSDFGMFAYIGCGKVTVSMNDFKGKVRSELKKQGWEVVKDWFTNEIAGMPVLSISAEKKPYILAVNVHWPPENLPTTVTMMWIKTHEPTEEEQKEIQKTLEEEQEKNKKKD